MQVVFQGFSLDSIRPLLLFTLLFKIGSTTTEPHFFVVGVTEPTLRWNASDEEEEEEDDRSIEGKKTKKNN